MVNQQIFLPMIPDSAPIVINISQYDYDAPGYAGRLYFNLISNGTAYDMNGATAVFQGEKPDGTTFAYPGVVVNASVVRVNVRQQMTLVAGRVRCNLILNNSEGQVGSFNVWLEVQESATAGSDPSQTDIPALVAQAKEYADEAAQSAADAAAWSANPAYIGANNNWFVYDVDTQQYVDSGVEALGQGIESIEKTSTSGLVDTYTITYSNGSTATFEITNGAEGPAGPAGPAGPQGATGETGQQGPTGATPVISVSATADATSSQNPTVTVTKGGTDEAPTFLMEFSGLKGQQGIQGEEGPEGPTGNGIVSIVKTATAGLVDTYTITMTNGSTATFTVTNGQNGTGSGDMLKANYDPNDAVYNAGGIVSYVASILPVIDQIYSATSSNAQSGKAVAQAISGKANTADLAAVATSGSYNDLSDKPTIPSIANCYQTGDSPETAIADEDYFPYYDTSASAKRKTLWSNIKSVLKTYFDTLYSTVKTRGTPTSGGQTLSLVNTGDMYTWNNKANTSDLDEWTATSTVQSDNTVIFTGLNDAYGYDLFCNDKLIGQSAMTKTGSGTNVTLKYTVTGAASGDVCKLRILK